MLMGVSRIMRGTRFVLDSHLLSMRFILEKKYQQKTFKGFSLGEVLLAAFVLTAGLLSLTALMASSLRNSFETRDAIIATELAQEGVELVRNVRDNDFAVGGGFTAFDNTKRHCRIDYDDIMVPTPPEFCHNTVPTAVTEVGRYNLQYSGGFYRHISTTQERFSRYIYIDYDSVNAQTTVRSFVYWGDPADPLMFKIGSVGGTGITTQCTVAKKCVFTEVTLTSWE